MVRSVVPSIVPSGGDQTVYLVINNYGKSGAAYRKPMSIRPTSKPSSAI